MKINKMTLAALLIALSSIGANIKIMGSIAFDSLPAFLAAIMLGPAWGALIGALGHVISALLSGFPFGIPAHAAVAISMAVTMFTVGFVYRKLKGCAPALRLIITGAAALFCNGPLALALSWPFMTALLGAAAALALLPVLLAATAANVLLAFVLLKFIGKVWSE